MVYAFLTTINNNYGGYWGDKKRRATREYIRETGGEARRDLHTPGTPRITINLMKLLTLSHRNVLLKNSNVRPQANSAEALS
jgi:hypothetical protein